MSADDRVIVPGEQVTGALPSLPLVPLDQQGSHPRGGSCPVPDLVGLGSFDAYALARNAGLRLSVSVWQTTVGPWGRVLDQRPGPDGRLRRGGKITVTVSGRPYEQVPDVLALPLADAIERLVWLGFVPLVEARRSSCSVSAGQVLATRPAAGALLASGSVLALTVASSRLQRVARSVSHPSGDR